MKNTNFSVYEETQKWLSLKNIDFDSNEIIGSTNDEAKKEAFLISTPLKVYLANQQTAGRGRGKNTWTNANKGDSLLSTWSFSLDETPQAITAPLIGLAIYEALTLTFRNLKLSIKPPNDIYLNDKKIAGLLVETVKQGESSRIIIGLGLNIFSNPSEINNSGYLADPISYSNSNSKLNLPNLKENDWHIFLDALLASLKKALKHILAQHLSEETRSKLLIAINNNPNLKNKFISISPFGDLSTLDQIVSWRNL
jgi:BirA family biotin operon repressor/biotin-[acetyl-CoA-carboxylase] ligase